MTNISYGPAIKTIGKLLELRDDRELVLPEIQRDFVWSKKSIKSLIDSIYQGLPIGHMLVWKTTRGVESKAFDKQRLKRNARIDNFYGYLLDGQQRLTALAHLRDGDEQYPLMFYVWPDRDRDETLYWRGKHDGENPWCIPVSDFLERDFDVSARINRLRHDPEFRPHHEEIIRRDLGKMESILKYPVSITEFETDNYAIATELFVRFNSTGTKLRRSDLSVAELAVHVPGLVSKDIRRAQSKWPSFPFTVPFLVQCLLAVHTKRFQLKDSAKFWAAAKSSEVKQSWGETETAVAKLVDFLTGTMRWTSESLVPSFNALIPLVVLLAHGRAWSAADRKLARKWLMLASVRAYFSGSVQTQLDQVLRELQAEPTTRRLWSVTKKKLRPLRPSDFATGRLSGPAMSLYLSMIRERDARDWKNESPLDGSVLGHNASLQIHHIFPKSLLNKQTGLSYSDVNTFANYAVLSASTNLNVSSEEPGTYLPRIRVRDSELQKQCLPSDQKLWRISRYKDFLERRRALLAKEANAYLGA